MDEDSLLETPLDKVEPYGLFRDALLSNSFPKHVHRTATNLRLQDYNKNSRHSMSNSPESSMLMISKFFRVSCMRQRSRLLITSNNRHS